MSFFSKLLTGNPFAQGSVGDNARAIMGGVGIPGMPSTSLQSILGGKGGAQQAMPPISGNTISTPSGPTDQGVGGLQIPQHFGGGLLGASRRGFGVR